MVRRESVDVTGLSQRFNRSILAGCDGGERKLIYEQFLGCQSEVLDT
jgi:hypothetical protein